MEDHRKRFDTAADFEAVETVQRKGVMPAKVGGQKMTGKAYKRLSAMHDSKGRFKPNRSNVVVVGNSAEGTTFLAKRDLHVGRASSFKKLGRASRIAAAEAGTQFADRSVIENRHVHPRHKRVQAEG
jgi:hypothetical protein